MAVEPEVRDVVALAHRYAADEAMNGHVGGQPVVVPAGQRVRVRLVNTDNGPGMSEESRQLLFTPFFRAPEARGRPGHGLGLATTKRLVEAHGGTIEVRTAIGVGTHVTVRLPLAHPSPDHGAPRVTAAA